MKLFWILSQVYILHVVSHFYKGQIPITFSQKTDQIQVTYSKITDQNGHCEEWKARARKPKHPTHSNLYTFTGHLVLVPLSPPPFFHLVNVELLFCYFVIQWHVPSERAVFWMKIIMGHANELKLIREIFRETHPIPKWSR